MSGYNRKPDQYSMPNAGRPSPKKEITMPAADWERLDQEAERRGLSRSALVREALAKYFQGIDPTGIATVRTVAIVKGSPGTPDRSKTTMTTARKIAHVPGLGLMAMPATYDPARITAEDATHDSAICGAVEELRPLRDASIACAELARDTASEGYTDEEATRRERLAERALDVTEGAWDDAIRAAADGNAKDLADAIGRARNVAEEWGDSTQEKAALALVAGLS